MDIKQSKHIADLAWSGLMNMARTGPHGLSIRLEDALKSEKSRTGAGIPVHLAKIRLVESAIIGAANPVRNLVELHGLRGAHIEALMIGAKLGAIGCDVAALAAGLEEAAKVLQAEWVNK